jgi:O-antigen ligase/tetratricopeptide (TPR) repeat protein
MNRNTLKNIVVVGLYLVTFIPFLVSGTFFFPFITTKAFAWRIIVEAVFFAWILLALLDSAYRPKKGWLLYSLFIFIAVIGLSDLFGVAPLKSFWSNAERMEGFISLLHLGMYFLAASSVFNADNWRRWWNISLTAAAIMSLYCFMQLMGVYDIHQGGVRVDGTLGNAAYLAVYMLIHIFIALYFFLREEKKNIKITYAALAFLYVVVLYYTATRGAILGLIGGLIIAATLSLFGGSSPRLKKYSIGYLVGIVVITLGFFALRNTSFVMGSPVLSRFSNISVSEIKTEGRSFVWPIALQGIKERPILGWGQENFNYVFNEHYKPEMYRIEPWFDRAHNIFLDWAIAGGVLGLIAYLSLYAVLIYYIWKRDPEFKRSDKVLLTGLIAAYFFHNLFVFDHLISYILFISLLAYVHSRSDGERLFADKKFDTESITNFGMPVALVLLVAMLYFVNVRPMMANATLISALQTMQTQGGDMSKAVEDFESAYDRSRLGRPEIVEQIASNASTIFQSNLSTEEKNAFYTFATKAVEEQVREVPTDARYQIVAGTYFMNAGKYDEALAYLTKANELIPGKQLVYYQLATVYINKGDNARGLEILKAAYELDKNNLEAETAYLVGAIYAGDRSLENSLAQDIGEKSPNGLQDDRIISAYLSAKRYDRVITIFTEKIKQNPSDPQGYINLAAVYLKAGDNNNAILTLERLGKELPTYKATADSYITQIKNGTIK